jgi:hypothetical protein
VAKSVVEVIEPQHSCVLVWACVWGRGVEWFVCKWGLSNDCPRHSQHDYPWGEDACLAEHLDDDRVVQSVAVVERSSVLQGEGGGATDIPISTKGVEYARKGMLHSNCMQTASLHR